MAQNRKIAKLVNQKSALEADFGRERYTDSKFGTISDTVLSFIADPVKLWEQPSYQDKRLVLNMFFEAKLPYDRETGFGTPETPAIIRILSQETHSKEHLVDLAEKTTNTIYENVLEWASWINPYEYT